MRFYREYILNLEVLPPEATKSMMQIAEDATVCRAMYVRTSFPVIATVPPPPPPTAQFPNSPLGIVAQA